MVPCAIIACYGIEHSQSFFLKLCRCAKEEEKSMRAGRPDEGPCGAVVIFSQENRNAKIQPLT